MVELLILLVAVGLLSFVFFMIRKYRNEYKLIMIFGKKGCGKTTTLNKLAIRYLRKGWQVYSTDYIQGTFQIKPEDFGHVNIPPKNHSTTNRFSEDGSGETGARRRKTCFRRLFRRRDTSFVKAVVLVDEVGLIWHARDWKSFDKKVREYLKLQRHYHVRIYLCSQSFDVDKSVRDLCDEMWLLVNVLNIFSYGKRIIKDFDIVQATAESPSTLVENLKFDSLFFAPFGSRMLTYIPKYAQFFDSFEAPELEDRVFDYRPIKDDRFAKYAGVKSSSLSSLSAKRHKSSSGGAKRRKR